LVSYGAIEVSRKVAKKRRREDNSIIRQFENLTMREAKAIGNVKNAKDNKGLPDSVTSPPLTSCL
jgi:hypothetical protein